MEVVFINRGKKMLSKNRYDFAFDCLGLCPDLRRAKSPLLTNLLSQGIASFDVLHLGLRATPLGNLISLDGCVQPEIFTLGSLRRGELWETTAVREIRVQTRDDVAKEIMKSVVMKS